MPKIILVSIKGSLKHNKRMHSTKQENTNKEYMNVNNLKFKIKSIK